jgi:hypothetical protein
LLHRILFLFQIFWLTIDIISGIFIQIVHIDVFAQIIRLIVFFILIAFILIYANLKQKIIFYFVIFSSIFLIVCHILLFQNYISIVTTIKVVSTILFFLAVKIQIQQKFLNQKNIFKIVRVNGILLLLNLSLYLFGIGFTNYDIGDGQSLGGSGFVFAANELGACIILIYILTLILQDLSLLKTNLVFLAFLLGSLIIMSKTAIFGLLLVHILYLFLSDKINYKLKLYVIISIFVFLQIIFIKFYDIIILIFNRWNYFYQSQGILYYLGGVKRWSYIIEIIHRLNNNPLHILIGIGWTGVSENSFFDLLEAYGIFGIGYYLFVFFYLLKNILLSFWNKEKIYLFKFLALFLVLLISFFAGHVVQSALCSLFLALLLNDLKNKKPSNENINN